mmetsp:Transcript_1677/g.3115  ORF Transcript_1677/g.3115 Transcript_1677/m.3115 type:complete len:147 (-) Transcript_1677:123-563(-)
MHWPEWTAYSAIRLFLFTRTTKRIQSPINAQVRDVLENSVRTLENCNTVCKRRLESCDTPPLLGNNKHSTECIRVYFLDGILPPRAGLDGRDFYLLKGCDGEGGRGARMHTPVAKASSSINGDVACILTQSICLNEEPSSPAVARI